MSYNTIRFGLVALLIGLFGSLGNLEATPQSQLVDEEILAFDEIDLPLDVAGEQVKMGAAFKMKPNSKEGILYVKALIAPGWHLYSVTQPPGGPETAVITVANENIQVQAAFKPSEKPHVKPEPLFDNMDVEYHENEVVWTAPFRIQDDTDPEDLEIEVNLYCQACSVACDIFNLDAIGEFADYLKVETKKTYVPSSHVDLGGTVEFEGVVKPGSKLKVKIKAIPQPPFHIYAYQQKPAEDDSKPTLIAVDKNNGWKIGEVMASAEPVEKSGEGAKLLYHEDEIEWTFDVEIPSDFSGDSFSLGGLVGFQTCTDKNCDPPESARFEFEVEINKPLAENFSLNWQSEASYKEVAEAISHLAGIEVTKNAKPRASRSASASAEEIAEMATYYKPDEKIKWVSLSDLRTANGETVAAPKETTIWTAIIGAFLGGMLLNLMPCVFPVLGLKVLGFVQLGGSDPRKIRMHGFAFSLGLVASMWVLAAVILGIREFAEAGAKTDVNWGMQMSSPYFVGAIVLLMYILGLNMAGVFEIGQSLTQVGGSKLAQKKGYSGSFFSGVLTTVVATPCSGPFLGVAMSYTLSQTIPVAMFLFTIFGIGIAFPYLVLSFAPNLIRKLPKPGGWMETFKVTMSFALFATAAFFMQTFGAQTGIDGLSWMLMAMVIIGLALYFYGQWSLPEIKLARRISFGFAIPVALLFVGLYMSYDAAGYPPPPKQDDEWLNWYPGRVEYALAKENKIAFVDYTADW